MNLRHGSATLALANPQPPQPLPPISSYEGNDGLGTYCPACGRWDGFDLAQLVAQGHGARRLAGFKPRCSECGGPGQVQVRPPVPAWPGGVM